MPNKSFTELVGQTQQMIKRFQKIEQRPWGAEGTIIELSKQVGELSKLVMVQEKYYLQSRDTQVEYQSSPKLIADELFDIWYCLIRLAAHYEIDFEQTIDYITQRELNDFENGKIK